MRPFLTDNWHFRITGNHGFNKVVQQRRCLFLGDYLNYLGSADIYPSRTFVVANLKPNHFGSR